MSSSVQVNPNAGMSPETLARIAASDQAIAGIIAGRRRAAAALLVTSTDPERTVRENWEPVRQIGRPPGATGLGGQVVKSPVNFPDSRVTIVVGGDPNVEASYFGDGPPDLGAFDYPVGAWYLDRVTGDLYRIES